MFKKYVAFICAILLMVCGIAACGPTETPSDSSTDATTTVGDTTTTAATTESTGATTESTGATTEGTTGGTTASTAEGTTAVTTTTTKETTAKPTTTTVKPTTASPANGNNVEFYGRFLKSEDGWQFDWSGSAIEAGFNGTKVEMQLNLLGGGTSVDYFNVYIDGGEPTLLTVDRKYDWYTLAEGLPKGYHWVRIEKRTEGPQGAVCEFVQFDFGIGGKAAPAPARKARTIEVIGSSTTAGYGNMAANGWTGFKLIEEDAAHSYGKLAADALNADVTILGWSGGGMYQNSSGKKENLFCNDVFWRTLARKTAKDWEFEQKPDVLVINLGVNDFQYNSKNPVDGFAQAFTDCYVQFLNEARKLYPDTYFVCAMGPTSFASEDAICAAVDAFKAAGDTAVSYVALKSDSLPQSERFGADGHPSAKAHEVMAQQLTEHIAEKMGW